MSKNVPPSLRAPVRSATLTGGLYAVTLLVLTGVTDLRGPEGWTELLDIAAGPLVLFGVQVGALAGLLHLFVALRSRARRLARGEAMDMAGVGPFGLVALPLAPAVASTLGTTAAARSWLGLPGLVVLAVLLPLVALSAGRRARDPAARREAAAPRGPAPAARMVSRLRGASMLTAVTGLVFCFVSTSLVTGALLPLALLTAVPDAPPPLPAAGATAAGGGGGKAPTATVTGGAVPDPAAARRAGEAVHVLLFAGSDRPPDPLERTPVRRLPPWWEASGPPTTLPPHTWARDLYPKIAAGPVTDAERRFLERAAAHPANAAFDALAGVVAADVAGARWKPLGRQPLTAFEIPVPRYVELWQSVHGRIAGAYHLAGAGQPEEARRRLSTVVALGSLLIRDGPLTTDALVGHRIEEEGRIALAALTGENDAPVSRDVSRTTIPGRAGPTVRLEWLRQHAAAAAAEGTPRGPRWEAFALSRTFQPCGSLHATLFGPDPADEPAPPGTLARMIRHPQDRALAALLGHGLVGTRAGTNGWGWLPKVMSLALADRPAVTHCAPLVATLLRRP